MATKSSIHFKPCNVKSSEAHNRRTAEYMRNIGKSKIYIVSELTADNEQWINPNFGDPELQTHYDYIKRMVKEKTGGAAPYFFIVDQERIIRKVIRGYSNENTDKEIINAIKELL